MASAVSRIRQLFCCCAGCMRAISVSNAVSIHASHFAQSRQGGRDGLPLRCYRLHCVATCAGNCAWQLAQQHKDFSAMPQIYDRISDLIGDTKLLRLVKLQPDGVEVLAKAEFLNPGGSIKDRPMRQILDAAQANGTLPPAQRSSKRQAVTPEYPLRCSVLSAATPASSSCPKT